MILAFYLWCLLAVFAGAIGSYFAAPFLFLVALIPVARDPTLYRTQLLVAFITAVVFKNILLLVAINLSGDRLPDPWAMQVYLALDVVIALWLGLIGLVYSRLCMPRWIPVFVTIVLAYFVLGLSRHDTRGVLVYGRMYALPVLGYLAGIYLARREIPIAKTFMVGAALMLAYVVAEVLTPDYYRLVDLAQFSRVKYGESAGLEGHDFVAALGTVIGDVRLLRVIGPQIHPISMGYMAAMTCLILAIAIRSRLVYALAVAPLLLLALFSSKGAALLCGALALFVVCRAHASAARRSAAVITYTFLLLAAALSPSTSAFEHMKGLVGGILVATSSPLGHGIGFSGNSTLERSVTTGAESFFGLTVAAMGVVGVIIYALLLRWALVAGDRAARIDGPNPQARASALAGLYLALIIANSILQEEAFSPSAIFLPAVLFSYYGRRSRDAGVQSETRASLPR